MKKIGIVHIFYDVHMGTSHRGLKTLMNVKLKTDDLIEGEIVLFINAGWTAAKLLAPGNTLLYHRTTHGKLTLDAIRELPMAFGGESLKLSSELASALLKKFNTQQKKAA